jgi:hypothetical protein
MPRVISRCLSSELPHAYLISAWRYGVTACKELDDHVVSWLRSDLAVSNRYDCIVSLPYNKNGTTLHLDSAPLDILICELNAGVHRQVWSVV